MKVGIKFCGGCNPRYDRGEQVTALKEKFPEIQWMGASCKEVCDHWLVVCGCSRACAQTDGLIAAKEILYVTSPMDFQKIQKRLQEENEAEKSIEKKELKVGDQAVMEKQITKEVVEDFARLTGDYNKMHMDPGFAGQQWFGQPVAHGMLASALLSSVMGMKLPGDGTILMEESTEFKKPVCFGDTIQARITLTGYEEERHFYIGSLQGVCTNQNGEVVAQMRAKQMMMKHLFVIKKD
jgi:acyl dehydratase